MIRFSVAAFAAIFATLAPLAAAADPPATPSAQTAPSAMMITQSAENTAALPATGGFGPDGLPRVLSAEDVQRYQKIFALQRRGKWKAADREIAKLTNRRLMGHVLYQRLMHPKAYRAKYKELKDWMAKYADHPDARRVYRLALKRRPKNYKRPNRPEATSGTLLSPIRRAGTNEYMSPRKRSRRPCSPAGCRPIVSVSRRTVASTSRNVRVALWKPLMACSAGIGPPRQGRLSPFPASATTSSFRPSGS